MPPIPNTSDEFREVVLQSGLLTADRIRQYARVVPGTQPDAARALAERLVRDRLLTPFQSRQLLAGKIKGYFLAERYKILAHIANGVLGPLLLCEDLQASRFVAVKLLQQAADKNSPQVAAFERFVRDVVVSGSLHHPNILRMTGFDWAGNTPLVVTEYIDGTPLGQIVDEAGPLASDRASHYVRQAAEALQHAHARRVLHREVKPGHLILDRTGCVRLTDFGVAQFLRNHSPAGPDSDDDAGLAAAADWLSPEQALGHAPDGRADIYGLGATFYYLLTGRPPFSGDTAAEKLAARRFAEPTPVQDVRADVPDDLAALIARLLAKDPNDRVQSAAEVVAALAPWTGEPIGPPPEAEMPKAPPSVYRLGLVASRAPQPTPAAESFSVFQWRIDPLPSSATVRRPAPQPATTALLDPAHRRAAVTANGNGTHGVRPAADGGASAAVETVVGLTRTVPSLPAAPEPPPARPAATPLPATLDAQPALPAAQAVVVEQPSPRPAPPRPRQSLVAILVGAAGLAALLAVGGWLALEAGAFGPGKTSVKTGVTPPRNDPPPAATPPVAAPAPSATKPPDPPVAAGVEVRGSGSTFIKPAMERWSELYAKKTGVKIRYYGVGSGRGVDDMIDNGHTFGCTDAFMTPAQLAKARTAGGEVVHIPLAMGAVVVTYNLPEIKEQLKFTGPVLADIYLGKIKTWNHPAIQTSNPGVALPDLEIAVIRRSDSSGTTAIWTDYLTKTSPEWEKKIGTGNTVKWPVGEDAEKNDGVAKTVSRKAGAVGYVEMSFALERNLPYAQIKNQAGKYVPPSLETVTAAANASLQNIPSDLRYTLTDPPGEDSYPVVGTTWAVVYLNQTGARAKEGKEVVKFLQWAIHDGQEHLKAMRYAPLPLRLVALVDKKLEAVQLGD